MAVLDRFKKIWNAWNSPQTDPHKSDVPYGASSSNFGGRSPARSPTFRIYNEKTILASILTKMGVDSSGIPVRHVRVDDEGRYLSDMPSAFNDCLTIEPNIDQGPRAFRQDIVTTLFDKGVAAIVAVDTSQNPDETGFTDIYSMRVGEVKEWFPKHVRVDLYNEEKGLREELILKKRHVCIIENPLYAIMNEQNSTLQRLIRKLGYLDVIDEQSSSGKLDIIIQLPYVIKSEARRKQAEQRKEDIEFQLHDSKYGIAYTDGTEKITQLNRPAENNLLAQVEFLTKMLYDQLGLTDEVLNGSADEEAMTNYYNRTIEPIIDAIIEGMQRAFLGVNGVKRKERVMSFRDPFKFVPLKDIAEIADKFTRNEILTSNEIRSRLGIPPASDPKADQLVNSNIPQTTPSEMLERVRQNGS